MASSMQWTRTWATSGDAEGQGGLACCNPMESQRARHNWATEQEQKQECNNGSKGSDATTTSGTLTGKARRGKERPFPSTSGGGMAMVRLILHSWPPDL